MNALIGKVLVVTAVRDVAEGMVEVLKLEGHSAAAACSAAYALTTAPTFQPNVIILDTSANDIEMFAFIEKMRERLPEVMFIILATRLESAESRRLMEMGIRNHLVPYFDMDDLLTEVASCVYYLNGWNQLQAG